MLHIVFGCDPYHSMLPNAHIKLFNFIKDALYALRIDSGRTAFSFWSPCSPSQSPRPSADNLHVPNVLNFGRHSSHHSFLDDVVSCAIEMHSTVLPQTCNFAYHVFHSYDDVCASQGVINTMETPSSSTKRWTLPPNIDNIYFHKSECHDVMTGAELYCATAMRSAGGNAQHAAVCMGGDLGSIFVIKSAIEKGIQVFVIQQTGKLADCIAALKEMQNLSMQRSEILSNLLFMLQNCTSHDQSDSTDKSWLYVSCIR
jgi:hypothetical protein